MKNPIVYSCSGCSSAAQMANWIALEMDQNNKATMSCIAGVGGGVKSLVSAAQQADSIIGIDGCPLNCVKACLKQHDLECDQHFELSGYGVKKQKRTHFDEEKANELYQLIIEKINFHQST